MKKNTQKIIKIIILAIFLFIPSFSLAQNPDIPKPDPNKRPDECGEQCVRAFSDGYDIHLWYKTKIDRIKKDNETFSYYAIANGIPGITAGDHIYKSNESNFYIVGRFFQYGAGKRYFKSGKHYSVGGQKLYIASWDDTPIGDLFYNIIGKEASPSGIKDNVRYSWKIGTAGSIQLTLDSGTILFVPEAPFQYYLDSEEGPPLIQNNSKANNEGKFSVSTENTANEIWLNNKRVKNFYIYSCFEKDGQKYEASKNINFPEDFRPHSDTKEAETTLILDNIEIKLDQSNKVEACKRSMQASLTPVQEITQGKNWWEIDVVKKIVCWLKRFFVGIFYWLSNIAAYFIRENY